MEAVGAFLDQEWESLSTMFSFEDSDYPSSNSLFSNYSQAGAENVDIGSLFDDTLINPNFYCVSQESSNSSEADQSALFALRWGDEIQQAGNGVNFLHDVTANTFESMDFCYSKNGSLMPVFPDDVMEEILQLKADICDEQRLIHPSETDDSCKELQLKRKYETPGIQTQDEECTEDNSSESCKKKPRASRNAQKNKKINPQSKKNKKAIHSSINDEQVNNGGGNGQSSSTCSSEDQEDSNASQELNGGSTSESKGSAKAKAGKGPATDPQSLYARKRREKINERLRILQNLVPNGTKVDISTMLEEAVQYVKFLQLQIKLLSSDDLWMFAPIAYNGMDIGAYQKIVPNL